jgi:hypothetical protein
MSSDPWADVLSDRPDEQDGTLDGDLRQTFADAIVQSLTDEELAQFNGPDLQRRLREQPKGSTGRYLYEPEELNDHSRQAVYEFGRIEQDRRNPIHVRLHARRGQRRLLAGNHAWTLGARDDRALEEVCWGIREADRLSSVAARTQRPPIVSRGRVPRRTCTGRRRSGARRRTSASSRGDPSDEDGPAGEPPSGLDHHVDVDPRAHASDDFGLGLDELITHGPMRGVR